MDKGGDNNKFLIKPLQATPKYLLSGAKKGTSCVQKAN